MFKINFNKKYMFVTKKIMIMLLLFIIANIHANEVVISKRYDSTSSTPQLTQTIINQQIGIVDNASFYNGSYIHKNLRTLIKFGIDGLPNTTYLNGFDAFIEFKITPVAIDGTTGVSYDEILSITYNPNLNVGKITDLEVLKIINTRGVIIDITNFYFKHNGVVISGNPGNVYLDLEHHAERYEELSSTQPITSVQINTNEEIEFGWTGVVGAEEYELEWTWIDNYGDTVTTSQNTAFTLREFKNNNSRVRLKSNQLKYTIPDVFSKGNILFRVRAIGRFLTNVSKKYYGNWSTDAATYTNVEDWPINTARITVETHQTNKNWQYQTSFAENGKKKEVVSYFDGTLRNRQTVTKINTNNQVVVGEVIYDNQGRPAIEVLPTPIHDPTNKNKITFYPNLNQNQNNSIYTHNDFDWDVDPNVCNSIAGLMNKNSGSSRYYSNTGNNDASNLKPWQGHVPDAKLYPFSQIEYTPDNTGRISRKSGVGLAHQLNSDHEMKYFYLTPSQSELNRLFGYNVGNAEHYKKNIVADPNKQVSISYIDPQGRTIATALAGDTPNIENTTTDLMLPLDDENNKTDNPYSRYEHEQITQNLLEINNRYYEDEGYYGIKLNKVIGVTGDLEYTFNYNLPIATNNFTPFIPNTTETTQNCNITYPYKYDLKISLLDKCGDNKLSVAPNVTNIAGLVQPYTEITALSLGTYSLTKEVRVNKEELEDYAEQYINNFTAKIINGQPNQCYIDPDSFAPQTNFDTCATTCEGCAVDLVSLYNIEFTLPDFTDITAAIREKAMYNYVSVHTNGSYINNAITYASVNRDGDEMYITGFDSFALDIKEQYINRFKSEFNLIFEACLEPCSTGAFDNECAVFSELLTFDMSPGGQYADDTLVSSDVDGDGVEELIVTNPSSVFNENNFLLRIISNIPVGNKSWRDINFKDTYGNDYRVYLNIDNDGNYTPEVLDVANIQTDTNGSYIYPQQLKNIKDFLEMWQSNWAMDLIILHPEYIYNVYQQEICTFMDSNNTNITMSSNGYDSYLKSIETFDEAWANGIFNNTMSIFNEDPYFNQSYIFDITTTINTYNSRRSIMTEALQTKYEGQTNEGVDLNMFEYAYFLNFSQIPTNGNTISQTILGSDGQRDILWKNYRDFYISLKRKVSNFLMHMYAKQKGEYNFCIGIDSPQDFPNTQNTNFLINYTQSGVLSNYFNALPITNNQVNYCGYFNDTEYAFYKTKEKRFLDVSSYTNNDNTAEQNLSTYEDIADYGMWMQTGRCPLSYDLEYFLDTFFKEINENTTFTEFSTFNQTHTSNSITSDLLSDIANQEMAQLVSYDENTEVNTNQNLNIFVDNFNPNIGAQYLVENFEIAGFSWSNYNPNADSTGVNGNWNINKISNLYYTNTEVINSIVYFKFQVLADVFDKTSGTLTQTIMTGKTIAKIGECSTEESNGIGQVLDGSNSSLNNGSSFISDDKLILFENLLNHLREKIVTNQTDDITSGYYPTQLAALAPHIQLSQGQTLGIYNFNYVNDDDNGIDFYFTFANIDEPRDTSEYISNGYNYIDDINIDDVQGVLSDLFYSYQNVFLGLPLKKAFVYDVYIHESVTPIYGISLINIPENFNYNNFFNLTHENILRDLSVSGNPYKYLHFRNMDLSCGVPQQIAPVSCTDKYNDYINFLNLDSNYESSLIVNYILPTELRIQTPIVDVLDAEGNPNSNFRADALDYFCSLNLGYFVEPYSNYITGLNINTTYDYNYMSIETFSNTGLGQDLNLLNTAVAEYIQYNTNNPDINVSNRMFWHAFTDNYLANQIGCPPLPTSPTGWNQLTIDNQPINNCNQFAIEIQGAYSAEAYQSFLNSLKVRFKREYVEQALSNITETFTEKHLDKEYQYTLYYYDQAGNLIQTVPPEGVERKDNDEVVNDKINKYRLNRQVNPQPTESEVPNHRLKTQYKYNTLNQLVWQKTPDGGETRFAYDKLGRIVASQNAKQENEIENNEQAYSYTKYDELGRITEAGETYLNETIEINENGRLIRGSEIQSLHGAMDTSSGIRKEVSITRYDQIEENKIPYFESYANNTRGRVTTVYYYNELPRENTSTAINNYKNGIYYDYDVHGNVKEIVREIKDPYLISIKQHIKRTKYEYDLISGNVNKVIYQRAAPDQFIHKYQYDSDNRITNVQTSKDAVIWEKDSNYKYYDHGPLARTELGEHQVQGLDYAYTLQGWLKAVNGELLTASRDLGKDGNAQSIVAKDAFAYALHYYKNDYFARQFNWISNPNTAPNDLYNGNIKAMTTSLLNERGEPINTAYNQYRYDQLNRIKSMNSTEKTPSGVTMSGISANYSFDRNGNLTNLKRWAKKTGVTTPVLMDYFTYKYNTEGSNNTGNIINNRLQSVEDTVAESLFGVDIDNQGSNNYQYDQIGQLTKDLTEEITKIDWTVSGKVAKITKEDVAAGITSEITFEYDALGNRIAKEQKTSGGYYSTPTETKTYYIRDAQGNVLSIYKKTYNGKMGNQYVLEEQNIYGSARVGLQQVNLNLTAGGKVPAVESNKRMRFDTNYEARFTETQQFSFKTGETINVGVALDVTTPETIGTYSIAKFESQDTDSITKLHQIKLLVNYENGEYKPQLELKTYKDSVNIKTVIFKLATGIKTNSLNINYDVQIIDANAEEYDVILTLGAKDNYIIGNGLTQQIINEPYTQTHTAPENKIADNQDNPLTFDIDEFNYTINGKARTYQFEKGFGNPVSTDGLKTMQAIPSANWINKGITIAKYQRQIGDKRYELSNHLGNVLSVITDHKALGTTTILEDIYKTSFDSDKDPWQASTNADIWTEEGRLVIKTGINLNGANGYYDLEAGKTYQISLSVDKKEYKAKLEFSIWRGGKKYSQYIDETGVISTIFVAESTGTYRLNLRLREKGYEEEPQVLYIDDVLIRVQSSQIGLPYLPEVVSYNDYYPYGMLVPHRTFSSPEYRYGFQGQEKDDEVKGNGNSLNYKYRMHDPRLGRFFAVDPLTAKYPWYTPYQFSGNKVIQFLELEGLEEGENQINIGAQIKAGWHAFLGFFGDRNVVSQVKEQAAEIGDFNTLDHLNKTQKNADTEQLKILFTYADFVGNAYGSAEIGRMYEYHIEGNKDVYEVFNRYSALSDDSNLTSDTFWGTLSAIPIVGNLKHLKKLKFLKYVKGANKLKYSREYGRCAEFVSEFAAKYGDDIIDSGAKVIKNEINIGNGGLIGTMKDRLSDNGMHQFIEIIEDGKSIIFDNIHPEGIAKELYKLDGVVNGKLIIDLLDESKGLIKKEVIKKSK